jgi:hypothetical protein
MSNRLIDTRPTYDTLYANASVYLTCQSCPIDDLKRWAALKDDPVFSAKVAAFVETYEDVREYVRAKMAGK